MKLNEVYKKIGFSNIISIISLFISITCFVVLAKFSQEYSKIDLQKIQPKIIIESNQDIKINPEKTSQESSAVYDNILSDIDKLIEKIPEKSIKDDEFDFSKKINSLTNAHQTEKAEEESKIDGIAFEENNVEKNIKNKAQIAIFKTHEDALAAWFIMKKENPMIFENLKYKIEKIFNNNSITFYRLIIPAKDEKQAKNICKTLSINRINCVVI